MSHLKSSTIAEDLIYFLDLRKMRVGLQMKGRFVDLILMFVGKRTETGLSIMTPDEKISELVRILNISLSHAEEIYDVDLDHNSREDPMMILLFSRHCYNRYQSIRSMSPVLKNKYGPFGYLNPENSKFRYEEWLFDECIQYTQFQ